MTTPDNPQPVDGAPLVEPSRPRSLFQEKLDELERLQKEKRHAADPRVLEAQRTVDMGIRTARSQGILTQVENRLVDWYKIVKQSASDLVRDSQVMSLMNEARNVEKLQGEEELYWEASGRPDQEKGLFIGVRAYVAGRGFIRILRERMELQGETNLPPLPYRIDPATGEAGEWDLEKVKVGLKETEKEDLGFEEIAEGGVKTYRLTGRDVPDVRRGVRALQNYLLTAIRNQNYANAARSIEFNTQHLSTAILRVKREISMDDAEEQRLLDFFQLRFALMRGQLAATENKAAEFVDSLGILTKRTKEQIEALFEATDWIPYLAISEIEESDSAYFRLEGDAKKNKKNEIIEKLRQRTLKSSVNKGTIGIDGIAVGDLFEVGKTRKEDAEAAFEIAEQLLQVLGEGSRYATVIKMNDGSAKPLMVVLKEKFGGRLPIFAFSLVGNDNARKAILDPGVPKTGYLAQAKEVVDPENKGLTALDDKETPLRRLGKNWMHIFERMEDLEEEFRDRIAFKSTGVPALQRLIWLSQGIRNTPNAVRESSLVNRAKSYFLDFMMYEDCWTFSELLSKLRNPDNLGGNLVGGFDFGFWLGEFNGANDQRDKFAAIKDGKRPFLDEPLVDPESIAVPVEKSDIMKKFTHNITRKLNWFSPIERATIRKSLSPMFERVLTVALGFSYLKGIGPAALRAEYAQTKLKESVLEFMKPENHTEFDIPKSALVGTAKDLLEKLFSEYRMSIAASEIPDRQRKPFTEEQKDDIRYDALRYGGM